MPFREDLLNPIPGDNPSGANLRYAPAYDQLKEARREEDGAEQGVWQYQVKTADWPLVVKLASDLLAKKSKDLQIAAWLTEAAIHREGFAGLKQGLVLLHGLLTFFWDTVYPEIEDGDLEMRATPLNWVATQLPLPLRKVALTREGHDWFRYKESLSVPAEQDIGYDENKQQIRRAAIADGKLTPEEWNTAFEAMSREYYDDLANQIQQARESLAALDELSTEKFGDDAPSFLTLRDTLEEIGNTVRILLLKKGGPIQAQGTEEEPAEEEAAPIPAEAESQSAAPARALRAKAALTAEPENAEDAARRVAAVARWLRSQDARSPVPFLLLRALRWGELRANPYELDWRMLEAPPTEMRQNIKRLSQEGENQQLLEAGEEVMATPSGRAWLDLQRFVLGACDSLGYDAVARAIRSEIRALLADYPQLLEASLNDDTQAANAQTREMFQPPPPPPPPPPAEEPESPSAHFGAPPAEPAHANGDPAVPDDEELIQEAIRTGRTNDAVELVSQRLTQENTGRSRFQRKTQLAMVCMASGHEAVAFPILRELAGEIAERRLEAWESPAMIAHTLSLFYRCLGRMNAPAEERQRVYADICRLDPKRALELER
ncbi:MAG: type VI secretion system protein TssA [Bryobacteraceae bacterium]|jgi:type VI secretion system protein ImpA